MLNVIMLNAIMLNVVMLSVTAPLKEADLFYHKQFLWLISKYFSKKYKIKHQFYQLSRGAFLDEKRITFPNSAL